MTSLGFLFCCLLVADLGLAQQRRSSKSASVTSSSVSSSSASASQVVDFDCPEEFGYYPHPGDCTQYYVCVFGGALLESCTGGLMYSHELQTCDWPRNVGCGEAVSPVTARAPEQRQRERQPQLLRQPQPQQQQQQQQQQYQSHRPLQRDEAIPKHHLYPEEELGPAEEVESDRQQRVYRGQPATVGQVARDRDGLRHTNALQVAPANGREKLSVISFGTQQQYRNDSTLDLLSNYLAVSKRRKKRQTKFSFPGDGWAGAPGSGQWGAASPPLLPPPHPYPHPPPPPPWPWPPHFTPHTHTRSHTARLNRPPLRHVYSKPIRFPPPDIDDDGDDFVPVTAKGVNPSKPPETPVSPSSAEKNYNNPFRPPPKPGVLSGFLPLEKQPDNYVFFNLQTTPDYRDKPQNKSEVPIKGFYISTGISPTTNGTIIHLTPSGINLGSSLPRTQSPSSNGSQNYFIVRGNSSAETIYVTKDKPVSYAGSASHSEETRFAPSSQSGGSKAPVFSGEVPNSAPNRHQSNSNEYNNPNNTKHIPNNYDQRIKYEHHGSSEKIRDYINSQSAEHDGKDVLQESAEIQTQEEEASSYEHPTSYQALNKNVHYTSLPKGSSENTRDVNVYNTSTSPGPYRYDSNRPVNKLQYNHKQLNSNEQESNRNITQPESYSSISSSLENPMSEWPLKDTTRSNEQKYDSSQHRGETPYVYKGSSHSSEGKGGNYIPPHSSNKFYSPNGLYSSQIHESTSTHVPSKGESQFYTTNGGDDKVTPYPHNSPERFSSYENNRKEPTTSSSIENDSRYSLSYEQPSLYSVQRPKFVKEVSNKKPNGEENESYEYDYYDSNEYADYSEEYASGNFTQTPVTRHVKPPKMPYKLKTLDFAMFEPHSDEDYDVASIEEEDVSAENKLSSPPLPSVNDCDKLYKNHRCNSSIPKESKFEESRGTEEYDYEDEEEDGNNENNSQQNPKKYEVVEDIAETQQSLTKSNTTKKLTKPVGNTFKKTENSSISHSTSNKHLGKPNNNLRQSEAINMTKLPSQTSLLNLNNKLRAKIPQDVLLKALAADQGFPNRPGFPRPSNNPNTLSILKYFPQIANQTNTSFFPQHNTSLRAQGHVKMTPDSSKLHLASTFPTIPKPLKDLRQTKLTNLTPRPEKPLTLKKSESRLSNAPKGFGRQSISAAPYVEQPQTQQTTTTQRGTNGRGYNNTQTYTPSPFDPYYNVYDDDADLYKDIDYSQYSGQQQPQQQQYLTKQQQPSRRPAAQYSPPPPPPPPQQPPPQPQPQPQPQYNTVQQDVYQTGNDYADNYNLQDDDIDYKQADLDIKNRSRTSKRQEEVKIITAEDLPQNPPTSNRQLTLSAAFSFNNAQTPVTGSRQRSSVNSFRVEDPPSNGPARDTHELVLNYIKQENAANESKGNNQQRSIESTDSRIPERNQPKPFSHYLDDLDTSQMSSTSVPESGNPPKELESKRGPFRIVVPSSTVDPVQYTTEQTTVKPQYHIRRGNRHYDSADTSTQAETATRSIPSEVKPYKLPPINRETLAAFRSQQLPLQTESYPVQESVNSKTVQKETEQNSRRRVNYEQVSDTMPMEIEDEGIKLVPITPQRTPVQSSIEVNKLQAFQNYVTPSTTTSTTAPSQQAHAIDESLPSNVPVFSNRPTMVSRSRILTQPKVAQQPQVASSTEESIVRLIPIQTVRGRFQEPVRENQKFLPELNPSPIIGMRTQPSSFKENSYQEPGRQPNFESNQAPILGMRTQPASLRQNSYQVSEGQQLDTENNNVPFNYFSARRNARPPILEEVKVEELSTTVQPIKSVNEEETKKRVFNFEKIDRSTSRFAQTTETPAQKPLYSLRIDREHENYNGRNMLVLATLETVTNEPKVEHKQTYFITSSTERATTEQSYTSENILEPEVRSLHGKVDLQSTNGRQDNYLRSRHRVITSTAANEPNNSESNDDKIDEKSVQSRIRIPNRQRYSTTTENTILEAEVKETSNERRQTTESPEETSSQRWIVPNRQRYQPTTEEIPIDIEVDRKEIINDAPKETSPRWIIANRHRYQLTSTEIISTDLKTGVRDILSDAQTTERVPTTETPSVTTQRWALPNRQRYQPTTTDKISVDLETELKDTVNEKLPTTEASEVSNKKWNDQPSSRFSDQDPDLRYHHKRRQFKSRNNVESATAAQQEEKYDSEKRSFGYNKKDHEEGTKDEAVQDNSDQFFSLQEQFVPERGQAFNSDSRLNVDVQLTQEEEEDKVASSEILEEENARKKHIRKKVRFYVTTSQPQTSADPLKNDNSNSDSNKEDYNPYANVGTGTKYSQAMPVEASIGYSPNRNIQDNSGSRVNRLGDLASTRSRDITDRRNNFRDNLYQARENVNILPSVDPYSLLKSVSDSLGNQSYVQDQPMQTAKPEVVRSPSVSRPISPIAMEVNTYFRANTTIAPILVESTTPYTMTTVDRIRDKFRLGSFPKPVPSNSFARKPSVDDSTPPPLPSEGCSQDLDENSDCGDKPLLRVRPTSDSPDSQSTPGLTRGGSRNRGSATYTVSPNEAEPPQRGTPSTSLRGRPTLKPSTSIVSKASEYIDIYRFPPSRPEPIYPTPQVDKTAAKCRKDVCLLPDCSCGGKDIPGDLRPEETPQIVLLTFDDSVNDLNKQLYSDLFEKGRTNPNGCPISATFYVSHEWTDYSQVQNLYAGGHEIASHSVSHSFGEQFSVKKWTREIAGQREILSAYGGVRQEDIRGMRAPFLAVGGNKMFKMLYDSNFTYDSSMPVYENKPPSWPYTMDYKIFHDCMIPPCPTRSYPGVWEVPMVMWQDLNGGRCSMGDACSNPPAADGVYKMLIKNFERHFTSNRAPFGLFYHAAWFTQPHHKEGFIAFLDAINKMPEVWIIGNWQAIQWQRDPTPINRLNNFQPFQCNYPERPRRCNNPKVCNLWHKSGVRYMRTCQPCPEIYPWTGKTGVRNSRVDNEIITD